MKKQHIFLTAILSTTMSLAVIIGSVVWFSPAQAAPLPQISGSNAQTFSVSAMAFSPVQQNNSYIKDPQRQLLTLLGNGYTVTSDRNIFVAPLTLPDRGQLLTMVVSGEDYDTQGEVRVRFKRCRQNQSACVVLGETSSSLGFAGSIFETRSTFLQNEVVNNAFYTYFLELELTALNNSGLRAVRLEMVSTGSASAPVSSVMRWELSGNFTSFPIPNSGWAEVRICTDDLSHLPNTTHLPYVMVDGMRRGLSSNSCLTVQGYDIEIRRDRNTAASSGTYQILR